MTEMKQLKCHDCAFRARPRTTYKYYYTCDYLLLTGKIRDCCAGDECTRYLRTTPEIEKKAMELKRFQVKGLDTVHPLAYLALGAQSRMPPLKKAETRPGDKKKACIREERRGRAPLPPEERERRRKASQKKYYDKHRTEMIERARVYRETHQEALRQYNKAYYQTVLKGKRKKARETEE